MICDTIRTSESGTKKINKQRALLQKKKIRKKSRICEKREGKKKKKGICGEIRIAYRFSISSNSMETEGIAGVS